MKPIVIAYYTIDTPYEQEAETLRLSLSEYPELQHDIQGVPNLGSWQKNTQYKARFVASMLDKYMGQPLLYLDVDCIILQRPVVVYDLDADIAAVHFADSKELLSGTVFFGGGLACRLAVAQWISFCDLYPERLPDGRDAWDQRVLQMAINATPSCKFVELPQDYTYIVELTKKRFPKMQPVICHTRGAARFKKIINRGT
jgi:hypothetical protein